MSELRIIALPSTYGPTLVRKRLNGCTVEVLDGVDTKGQLNCRLTDGDDAGQELWVPPMWLKEPVLSPPGDVNTGGEW